MARLSLHPTLGALVLRALREFADLPEKGIVAGQAVASVLDRMQGYRNAPINDIDVFRLGGHSRLKRKSPSAIATVHHQDIAVGRAMEYHALEAFLHRMRSYRVSTVSRAGLLNFVNCHLPVAQPTGGLTAARVIQSFDLNCVRVAVDLATGELVWDRYYEEFLRYRRIEVVAVHTPWHTLLRALKKYEEVPDVSMDLEAVATIGATFHNAEAYAALRSSCCVTQYFGPKLMLTAERFRGYWGPYFTLEAETRSRSAHDDDFDVFTLKPRSAPDEALQRRVDQLHNASIHFAGPLLHGLFRRSSHARSARVQEVDALLSSSSAGALRGYFVQDPVRYSSGHITPRHAEVVSRFLARFSCFENVFAGLTLDEQFEAAKALQALHRSISARRFARLVAHATPAQLRSSASICELESRLHAQAQAPFSGARLSLPDVPGPWAAQGMTLVELASLDDFQDFESSNTFNPYCALMWEVRRRKVFALVISSMEGSCRQVSLLKLKASRGRPAAVLSHEMADSSGSAVLPERHKLMCAIVLAKLIKNPAGRQMPGT